MSLSTSINKRLLPYLLLAPALVVYVTFSLIPLAGVFRLSLYRTNFIKTSWVGLGNYAKLLTDEKFLGSLLNSFLYVILTVPLSAALSVLVALLIYNTSEKWQNFAKVAVYIPGFVGAIILSSVWLWIWNTDAGIVNNLIGKTVPWFTNRWLSIIPIVISSVMSGWGHSLIIHNAVLKGVSKESIDAAQIDGANWVQIKMKILLPQLYKAIVLLSLLGVAGTFQMFYWIEFMAPYDYAGTLMWRMYKTAFSFSKYGRGSAYAVVLMVIILIVAMIQRRLMRREK